ncbi:hypothetical protein SAMN05518871_10412 [Psychrobacillus sp. OK028]|nr:hypothetical protein SAMN05518871_10412 [Psychrobacillus sp. OK028]
MHFGYEYEVRIELFQILDNIIRIFRWFVSIILMLCLGADGLASFTLERGDLLSDAKWVLLLGHRLLLFGGGLLSEQDLLDYLMHFGFSHRRKASFFGLLSEWWGLLADEVDLLSDARWVLSLVHQLLSVGGALLSERDLLENLMHFGFSHRRKASFLGFTLGVTRVTRGRGGFTRGRRVGTLARPPVTLGPRRFTL